MKQYDLEIPVAMRVLPFVVLSAVSLVIPVIVIGENGPARFALLGFLGVVAWQWWVFLSIAYRIVIHEDGTLEWIAVARRVRLRPEAVQAITPDRTGNIGFFRMVHAAGKVRFVNQITGFHEVVMHIKTHNPVVILKGC